MTAAVEAAITASAAETRRALGLALGLWALAWAPYLLWGGLPVYRDLLTTYLPLRVFLAEQLHRGHLPGWFPYEGLGEPFIGQGVTATFHPAALLYLLLSPAAALRGEVAAASLTGLVGQVLLGRALGLRAPASALAGIALAFHGYALSLTCNPPYLRGLSMLPWVAWTALEMGRSARPWRWAGALGLCWGLIPLGGDAAATLLAAPVAGAMGLLGGRRAGPLLGGAALAALVAAPELVPGLFVRRESIVAHFSNAAFLSRFWALPPGSLPELLLGPPPPAVAAALAAARHEPGRWAESVFMGALPLGLLLGLDLRQGAHRAVAGLGLLGLWLALGAAGGLEWGLRTLLPFLNTVRNPEKHLALAVFALSLGAGLGLEGVLARPARLAAAAVATAVIAALLAWTPLLSLGGLAPELQAAWSAGWSASALRSAALLAVAAGALALRDRLRWLPLLLPLLGFVELWSEPLGMKTQPPALLGRTPVAQAIQARATRPAPARVWAARGADVAPVDDESMAAWAAQVRERLLPDAAALDGLGSFTSVTTLPMEPRTLRRVLGFDLDRARPLSALYGFGFRTDADGALVAQADVRAYAARPRWFATEEALVQALRRDPASFLQSPGLVGTGTDGPPGPVGEVRLLAWSPDAVALEARLDAPGLIVLNEQEAPGWVATLDGADVPIVAPNLLARGVFASAGTHQLQLRYAPAWLWPSVFAGLLGGLLCLGLMRRRASERPATNPAIAAKRSAFLEQERVRAGAANALRFGPMGAPLWAARLPLSEAEQAVLRHGLEDLAGRLQHAERPCLVQHRDPNFAYGALAADGLGVVLFVDERPLRAEAHTRKFHQRVRAPLTERRWRALLD